MIRYHFFSVQSNMLINITQSVNELAKYYQVRKQEIYMKPNQYSINGNDFLLFINSLMNYIINIFINLDYFLKGE